MKNLPTILLLAALALAPAAARAERWRCDVLVFLNPLPSVVEPGAHPQTPDASHSLSLDDAVGLESAGITLLPETDFRLGEEAQRLGSARAYTVLHKLSWVQNDPPANGGPALRVLLPSGSGDSGLQGWLRLTAGRFAHLEADLEYTATGSDGLPVSWRLREKRKLPAASVHYLDGGRIGLLARISRAPVSAASP